MYIDTHCHLNFPQFDSDRAMVIGNSKKAGVKLFINPGVDLYSSKQALEIARNNPGVIFAAAGFHPYEAQHDQNVSDLENLIKSDLSLIASHLSPSVIAIGECGLDYHQYIHEAAAGKKDKQKHLFEEHLLLALKLNLPVIMHCREAFADFFNVLDSLPEIPKGVIHCFGGGLADLRSARERRLFVGVDGNVTYSKQLEITAKEIPPEILLLETDAPFLTPIPNRGTRNEPKYIPLIAKKIAEIKNIPVKDIEEQTTLNAKRLFGI